MDPPGTLVSGRQGQIRRKKETSVVSREAQAIRRNLWLLGLLYLGLHGFAATCLPDRFDPLSTFFIVFAEIAAIVACLSASRRAETRARVL
jgi:hypothetical protein